MDPLHGSPWSAPGTVAGFAQSSPNATLLRFAEAEFQRGGACALDIGCGAARNALPLAQLGWSLLGVDLSQPMIDAAAARIEREGMSSRVQLALAPMDALPTEPLSASRERDRHEPADPSASAAPGAHLRGLRQVREREDGTAVDLIHAVCLCFAGFSSRRGHLGTAPAGDCRVCDSSRGGHTMRRIIWSATVAAILIAAASGLHAQQKIKRESITPIRDVAGAATYKQYCTQCHGTTGIGDGPVANLLKVAPADLTRIAQRREGRFPFNRVKQIILGDYEVAPHGSRDMPLWGRAFRSMEDGSVAELRLVNLVKYVENIQQK